MTAKCEDCGKFAAVTYPVWLGVPYYTIDRDVCRRCAESLGIRRGLRRGVRIGLTGDPSSLRQMRRAVEKADTHVTG